MRYKYNVILLSLVFIGVSLTSVLFAQKDEVDLSPREKIWIVNHPVLKVANELDWPPFDFAENGEPKGYSIDMVKLAIEKVGTNVEFVNGFSWAELLEKFKAGEIDIMPAIYENEERHKFTSFTKSYFSQPTVIVVQQDNKEIAELSDLYEKKVAVIEDFVITNTLEDQHPQIKRIPVPSILDGIKAVSLGKVDAFIESIGVVSYLTEQNYIPNIKIISDFSLKELDAPKLYMGVAKDRIVLRSILQKGLNAISREELNDIRQKWISIEIEQPVQIYSLSDLPWFEIISFSSIFFILVLILRALIKSRGFVSFRNLKIATKIIILLSTVAIIAVGVNGFISWNAAKSSLEQESFNKLTAVREMKASQIEDYFQQVTDQVITLSEDRMIIEAMKSFTTSFNIIVNETDYTDEVYANIVKENKQYYETVFKSKLIQNRAAGNDSFNEEDYWKGDKKAVILQNLYVTANPNSVGAKHLLSDAGDGSKYSKIHSIYHPIIRNYLEKFGYYDIFLVDHESGHILYSVFKEVDFGTNLFNGPYSNTNIARTFMSSKNAIDKDHFNLVDFESYTPSYFAPAAFISSPIKEGDKTIGVLIFQMPIDRINSIMTNKKSWSKVGLGKSGETYLVGQDSLLRNQSRFLIEDKENYIKMIKDIGLPLETINRITNLNSSIGLQPVITIGTKSAIRGETGTQIFPDYKGVSVLSSYKPLNIPDVNWVLMSEIDENEAFANVYKLRRDILIWVFCLIIVIVIIAFLFSKTITRPIEILAKDVEELAMGNLDVKIAVHGNDEIGHLSNNFNTMRKSIKKLVSDLEEVNQNLEKKVAERTSEIKQKQEMFETTLESLTHPFYVIDAKDYTLKLANSAAQKLGKTGLSTCYALTHKRDIPCDSKEHPCPLRIVKETKKPVVFEHTHYDQDGNVRFAEVHGYPIFDEKGNVIQMIEFSLDITERKLIEEQLRNRSAALKAAANGIVITDTDGIIRWVNPAFTKLTGYSHDEAIGKSPGVLKSGQHENSFYKNMWDTIKAKKVWHDELINKRKDGSLYTEEMTITPVLDEKSDIVNFVAIKQDVTERKELEKKLEDANRRMKGELDIGRDIQMSMLPLIFPAFPDHKEFSVYATLHPAREVGGDFYDFYFIDKDRFCFCIGDVSGKGVPAALFMAVTKTLIKSGSSNDFSTASILTHVNNEMSRDNVSSMFVTIFICILNIKSGKLIYTNAGHNPAYIKRTDGKLERLDTLHGPVIGAVDGLEYKENKLNLFCGDSILLYTDGVTEAMDVAKTLFSEDRLVEFLSSYPTESVENLVESLVKEVKKFEGEADQADDITVMAFKYLGKPRDEKSEIFDITIKNGLPAIIQVNERFNSFADEHGIPKSISRKMNMVFDEVLNNIISYAYEDKNEHDIDVTVELVGSWLSVKISDDGIPFDPFSIKTPNTNQSLEERDIGGLGIHLVRSMMDKFSYKREKNKNILTFVKHINSK